MSHELRTPIGGIVGFTDLMLDENLTLEHREMVDSIRRCSATLLSLVNDILDLAKIEADRIELEEISFNVEELVYDCCEIVRGKLEGKVLEILVDVADIHSWVVGDPTRLKQILINLLGNSIKFTESGQIIVRLNTVDESDGHIEIEFSVEDSGIGMTESQMETDI